MVSYNVRFCLSMGGGVSWTIIKWVGVAINLMGAAVIATNILPIWIGFLGYIAGSGLILSHSVKFKDLALAVLMISYLVIDIVGLIKWI